MWQKITKPYIESGELTVIGVVQEQHPDRAKLYRQWHQFDWPVFVDALNTFDIAAVPIPVAIDESGVVRHAQLHPRDFVAKFMKRSYANASRPKNDKVATLPDPVQLANRARSSKTADDWRLVGDAYFLRQGANDLERAVDAYQQALKLAPQDGRAHFRLGVTLRRRFESAGRMKGDAQAAVKHWGEALAIDPNQYIWRRRLQQYGPRLDKPYDFYFWVDKARADIQARGERSVELRVEPEGSELEMPNVGTESLRRVSLINRDPKGRITRDASQYVKIDVIAVPHVVRPGQRIRIRVEFLLDPARRPVWNNESSDLMMYVELNKEMMIGSGSLSFPNPKTAESREKRFIEFEIDVDDSTAPTTYELPAYALYYLCEKRSDKCRYLRQDFRVKFAVSPDAPTLR